MNLAKLNLTRKWRSTKFDDVVGQPLAIRLIKNSLYKNLIFPVYLFSGSKGCGKTTMGRIFSSALNCSQLSNFQNNPKDCLVPCLECFSCKAMKSGNHPDFIEIDAASNTGVENVRQIIDNASFVPNLGTRKIYLIDEAHMLSKAAFNALLKILEEPPIGVIFILATTDPEKILDTVKSRCFQIFFKNIAIDDIVQHLIFLCNQENIVIEEDAIKIIAQESMGSLRDAINILERARLAYETIDKKSVLEILGACDQSAILKLFDSLLNHDIAHTLNIYKRESFSDFNFSILIKNLTECLNIALWGKYNINKESVFNNQDIAKISSNININKIINMLEICYEYENTFSKSSAGNINFEFLLIKLSLRQSDEQIAQTKHELVTPNKVEKSIEKKIEIKAQEIKSKEWGKFLESTSGLNDALIISVFKQARFVSFNSENSTVEIAFAKNLTFFKESLEESVNLWKGILDNAFGINVKCLFNFNDIPVTNNKVAPDIIKTEKANNSQEKSSHANNAEIDLSDSTKWSKTNSLLKIFPGKVMPIKN